MDRGQEARNLFEAAEPSKIKSWCGGQEARRLAEPLCDARIYIVVFLTRRIAACRLPLLSESVRQIQTTTGAEFFGSKFP